MTMTDCRKPNGDLSKAVFLFHQFNAACVLCKGHSTYVSYEAGIAPMVHYLLAQTDLTGYSAADKIVGRAAAFLFVTANVCQVYAQVVTEDALRLFEQYHIPCTFGVCVKQIINRSGTGICPMEQAVSGINEPQNAFNAIIKTVQKLNNKS